LCVCVTSAKRDTHTIIARSAIVRPRSSYASGQTNIHTYHNISPPSRRGEIIPNESQSRFALRTIVTLCIALRWKSAVTLQRQRLADCTVQCPYDMHQRRNTIAGSSASGDVRPQRTAMSFRQIFPCRNGASSITLFRRRTQRLLGRRVREYVRHQCLIACVHFSRHFESPFITPSPVGLSW